MRDAQAIIGGLGGITDSASFGLEASHVLEHLAILE
jgi:hypothetical protein